MDKRVVVFTHADGHTLVATDLTEADAGEYLDLIRCGRGIRRGATAYRPGYWDTAEAFTHEEFGKQLEWDRKQLEWDRPF